MLRCLALLRRLGILAYDDPPLSRLRTGAQHAVQDIGRKKLLLRAVSEHSSQHFSGDVLPPCSVDACVNSDLIPSADPGHDLRQCDWAASGLGVQGTVWPLHYFVEHF